MLILWLKIFSKTQGGHRTWGARTIESWSISLFSESLINVNLLCNMYFLESRQSVGTKHSLVGLTPTPLLLPISCMKADLQQLSKSTIVPQGLVTGVFINPHSSNHRTPVSLRDVFSVELLTRDSLPSPPATAATLYGARTRSATPLFPKLPISRSGSGEGGSSLTLSFLPWNPPVLLVPQCLRIKHVNPSIRVYLSFFPGAWTHRVNGSDTWHSHILSFLILFFYLFITICVWFATCVWTIIRNTTES